MLECQLCRQILNDDEGSCPRDGGALFELAPGPPLLDGKYALQRVIDRGATGLVVAAKHLGLQRLMAVKMLDSQLVASSEAQARFRAEAEALGRLQHPNIVRVSDFGIDRRAGGIPYIAMEMVEGESLRSRLDRGRMSITETLAIAGSVAAALDHAHEQGICHHDLKPENVLLAPAAGNIQVKVVDFGLAGHLEAGDPVPAPGESTGGAVAGTPEYMAPELLTGTRAGAAADIYALGVLIYEMLAGRRPFDGSASDLSVLHLCTPPVPPSEVEPELPVELDDVVLGALSKEPGLRPASAGELVRRLSAAALVAEQRRWSRAERPRRLVWAALITATALLGTWLLIHLGLVEAADRRFVHSCFSLSRPRAPDPRLRLLSIDEATARADPTLIVERSHEVGDKLGRVLAAGAAAVGIDMLLPEQWRQSESFTNLIIDHPDRIVLALSVQPEGSYIGDGCVHGPVTLVLGQERASSVFGIANVDISSSGAVYQLRIGYRLEQGGILPSFAARLAAIAAAGAAPESRRVWIDYATPPESLPRISWCRLDTVLAQEPERFAGRIILLGQELTGSGDVYHGLPHPIRGTSQLSGLELQALMVNTLLQERPVRESDATAGAISIGIMTALLGTWLLLSRRLPVAAWLTGLLDLVYILAAITVFLWLRYIMPLAAVLVAQMIVITAVILVRARLRPYPQLSGRTGSQSSEDR
jgi:serine/threonine protein kinase